MPPTIAARVDDQLTQNHLTFVRKPLVIGGMAMEHYGMRPAGADIDLVIADADYQALAQAHPEKRKDLWGDLGVVIGIFEIWRSIALLDYEFFLQDALEFESVFVVSLDRLLFMRVCAMDVEKYKKDLVLMRDYYYKSFRNPRFSDEAQTHADAYRELHGVVVGGNYGK